MKNGVTRRKVEVGSATQIGLTLVSSEMKKLLWLSIFALSGCATNPPPDAGQVLTTSTYTLTVVAHCREGEVGCSDLTATLVNKESGQKTELVGSTYMVKCADGVTPCHLGFYDLKSPGVSVRAYPDGMLELDFPGPGDAHEPGTWVY